MKTRKLGQAGLEVSALGYGCMGLTSAYGTPALHDEAIATIRAANEGGITFFDTAEAYGPFSNEAILGEAVEPFRNRLVLGTSSASTSIWPPVPAPDGSTAGPITFAPWSRPP